MDFDLTPAQSDLLDSVNDIIDATGGLLRAQDLARAGGYDGVLDSALEEHVSLATAGLLERVLIAELLANKGAATTFGLRAVLTSEVELPAGRVVIADRTRKGPARFATADSPLVLLDLGQAYLIEVPAESVTTARSSYGYQYGFVDRDSLAEGRALGDSDRLRALWRLANAAEISGNAASATSLTAAHLRTRQQFGQPLSFYQALRHRLADVSVTTEATRWMVREAAFNGDSRGFDLVASYAAEGAAVLVPDLVQMCGARSFTVGFELQAYVMRLAGLRLEIGGSDRLAQAVLAHTAAGV